MELSLTKTGAGCYENTYSQVLRKEESLDAVVPDTLPDIAEVLETTALLLVRSKDVTDGSVRVGFNIAAHVIYTPEGESCPRFFEVLLPVSLSVEDAAIRDGCACAADAQLLSIDARMLNPRKVLVRADILVRLDCYMPGRMELVDGVENAAEGVYTKIDSACVVPVVSAREKTFVISEELPLSVASPSAQVLSSRVCFRTDEVKSAGSKLVFKGEALCTLLSRGQDDTLSEARVSAGFSQIMDMDTECDAPLTQLLLSPTGAYFELVDGGDGRTVRVELHVLAQAVCCRRLELSYLSDAYSNRNPLELSTQALEAVCARREVALRENMRQVFETPWPAREVISAKAVPGAAEFALGEVKLPVSVSVIYLGEDGAVHAGRRKFDLALPLNLAEGEQPDAFSSEITDLYLAPSAEGIELRAQCEVIVRLASRCSFSFVSGIVCQEDTALDLSDAPSLVLIRAGGSGSLWELARDNCSSVAAIRRVNGLEESEEENGARFLLIPRTR